MISGDMPAAGAQLACFIFVVVLRLLHFYCKFCYAKRRAATVFAPSRLFPIEKNEPVISWSFRQPEINFALLHATPDSPTLLSCPSASLRNLLRPEPCFCKLLFIDNNAFENVPFPRWLPVSFMIGLTAFCWDSY